MRKLVLALLPLVIVAGCKGHNGSDAQKPAGPVEKGMPLEIPAGAKGKGVNVNAEIMRMHKVAGRWQSQPGVLPSHRDEWLVVDVSNDMKFVMSVRSHAPGGKVDAVNVEERGSLAWTKDGILTGTGTGGRDPIKSFSSWRGSFPSQGVMTVRAPDGKSYDLTYRGL